MTLDSSSEIEKSSQLLKAGDADAAIAVLESVIREQPALWKAYLIRGDAFQSKGHLEEALMDYGQALRLGSGEPGIAERIRTAESALNSRIAAFKAKKRVFSFEILRYLGAGWEGAVYLGKNAQGQLLIVKKYYPHRVKKMNNPVHFYSEPVGPATDDLLNLVTSLKKQPTDSLYSFQCILEKDQIVGIYYPYEKLFELSSKFSSYRDFSETLLYSLLDMQSYLLGKVNLISCDVKMSQFMLNEIGQLKYIDYGATITPTNDFRCQKERWHVMSLIRTLYQLYNPASASAFDGKNFDVILQPEIGLLPVKKMMPQLTPIFKAIEVSDYHQFLSASFYSEMKKELSPVLSGKTLQRLKWRLAISSMKNKLLFRS